MAKVDKHIEIVRSTTNGLSSMSMRSANAILGVLERHYTDVQITAVNNYADLESIASRQPDLVFTGMKYIPGATPGTKVWISEFLDIHGLEHTGSSFAAIEYEQSKPLAKQRVQTYGIPTARHMVLKKGQAYADEDIMLQFPLFVKPASLGGGAGIDENSCVRTMDELRTRVSCLTERYTSPALVEEYLPGREFSVAILTDQESGELEAMPIELSAPTDKFGNPALTREVKAANEEVILPVNEPILRARIISTAKEAFAALGARDYGRIDIRLDEQGTPHFLEANLIPSLISGYGSFPKACMLNKGLGYEETILRIVSLAFGRRAGQTTEAHGRADDMFVAMPVLV